MKNLFIKTALAAALLFAPAGYATETHDIMKWGGGIAAVGGGAGWYLAKDEADDCRETNATSNSTNIICTNQSDLDDQESLYGGIALVGGVVMVAGFLLENSAASSFRLRARPDGALALEGVNRWEGMSLAAKGNELALQKRWTF